MKTDGHDTLITVHIKPRQQVEQFVLEEESLTVKIKASPTKGKANKRIIQLFRKTFNTEVLLASGATSSLKVIRLKDIEPTEILNILLNLV